MTDAPGIRIVRERPYIPGAPEVTIDIHLAAALVEPAVRALVADGLTPQDALDALMARAARAVQDTFQRIAADAAALAG